MAFDAHGNYILRSDKAVRHVLVATHAVAQDHNGKSVDRPVGYVMHVAMLGHTNVPGAGKGNSVAKAAWIEHATAKVGDVLTHAGFAPLIADAEKKTAAVKAAWAQVAASRHKAA